MVEPAPLRPPPRPPISEADEDAAMRAVQEQIRARWQDATTPVAPPSAPGDIIEEFVEPQPAESFSVEEDVQPAAPSTLVRNLVAVIAGAALAIAAAGLWLGRQDIGALPVVGEMMAQIAPPLPVEITVTGTTSDLSSGNRVLEATGTIINRGKATVAVPALEATLGGPEGQALRWTIPPPRRQLGPNQQVAYTSTVTGFPESATKLQVRALE